MKPHRRLVALALWLTVGGLALAVTARHGFMMSSEEGANSAIMRVDGLMPLSKGSVVGTQSVVICGQLANNGTIYLGPVSGDGSGAGEGIAEDAGGTACNALDNATEATADAPVFATIPINVIGMYCRAVADGGTTGSGNNGVTFTLRSAAADTSPVVSCTVATTGIECSSFPINTDASMIQLAANATIAVKAVDTEDLSAMDGWCRVFYTF